MTSVKIFQNVCHAISPVFSFTFTILPTIKQISKVFAQHKQDVLTLTEKNNLIIKLMNINCVMLLL